MSDLNEIAKALAKAQGMMKPARMSGTNPHFKSRYATLQDIMEAAKDALEKSGLCYTQVFYTPINQPTQLETRLMHESGQSISSYYPIVPVQNNPQSFSSASTYAKRISLASILGICGDEDDDGNSASDTKSNHPTERATQAVVSPTPGNPAVLRGTPEVSQGLIKTQGPTVKQIGRLWAIAKQTGWSNQDVHDYLLNNYRVKSVNDLSFSQYASFTDQVMKEPPLQMTMPTENEEEDVRF